MKKSEFILLAVILGYVLAAGAQDPQKQPKLEHFDPNQADRSLDPCQDFYKFRTQILISIPTRSEALKNSCRAGVAVCRPPTFILERP